MEFGIAGAAVLRLQKWAELLLSDPDIGPDDPLPYDFLQAFISLWEDKGTQLAMASANRRALRDNLS
jgi:guanine nucleotide-binding protein subunit alpha